MSSAQPTSRRSNVPALPRVASNDASTSSSARPPSAGDALRRISYTRKLNRSNSEKINGHPNAPSGPHHPSAVSGQLPEKRGGVRVVHILLQQQLGNNGNHQTTNSLEEMSLSFMKVSSVKSTVTGNEHPHQQQQQQQQNGTKKKVPFPAAERFLWVSLSLPKNENFSGRFPESVMTEILPVHLLLA